MNIEKFNYDQDLAGIENWSVEKLLQIEKEAKTFQEKMNQAIEKGYGNNEDVTKSFQWARKVELRCDSELKNNGYREMKEWESLFV